MGPFKYPAITHDISDDDTTETYTFVFKNGYMALVTNHSFFDLTIKNFPHEKIKWEVTVSRITGNEHEPTVETDTLPDQSIEQVNRLLDRIHAF